MKKSILAGALLLASSFPAVVNAAIMYGDFSGNTVMYLDVTESNGTDEQKFGPPEINGDELDFNPTNFRAQSDSAAVINDSQLNVTIMSVAPDNQIRQILIDEGGDFTLSGLGAAEAVATVGTNVRFTITRAEGQPVSPACIGEAQLVFTPNANGEFVLPADRGTGVPWNGSLDYDVHALLASCGVAGDATKVEVVLDNTLTATAAGGGAAFIAKKDFRGLTITVPEPSSAPFAMATLVIVFACTRRRFRQCPTRV